MMTRADAHGERDSCVDGRVQQAEKSSGQRRTALWNILGRESAAGKALHNIYCSSAERNEYGAEATKRNRARHDALLRSGRTPPASQADARSVAAPPAGGGAAIQVPRFRPKADEGTTPAAPRPQRRPGAIIQAELEEDSERTRCMPLPLAKGPLLDDAEKMRYAEFLQFGGKPPEVPLQDVTKRPCDKPVPTSRSHELMGLFQSVTQEVQEREAFLADMSRIGTPKHAYDHVRLEIASRLKELERLDKLICAEERL